MKGFMFLIMSICLCLTSCTGEGEANRVGIGYLEESESKNGNSFFVEVENTKYSVPEVLCFNNTEIITITPVDRMMVTVVTYSKGNVKFFAGDVPQEMLEKKIDQTTSIAILVLGGVLLICLIGILKEHIRSESLRRELWYAKENQKKRKSN